MRARTLTRWAAMWLTLGALALGMGAAAGAGLHHAATVDNSTDGRTVTEWTAGHAAPPAGAFYAGTVDGRRGCWQVTESPTRAAFYCATQHGTATFTPEARP